MGKRGAGRAPVASAMPELLRRAMRTILPRSDAELARLYPGLDGKEQARLSYPAAAAQTRAKVALSAVLVAPRNASLYVYDFGDDWRHAVLVEAILPASRKAPGLPACHHISSGAIQRRQRSCRSRMGLRAPGRGPGRSSASKTTPELRGLVPLLRSQGVGPSPPAVEAFSFHRSEYRDRTQPGMRHLAPGPALEPIGRRPAPRLE